MFFLIFKVNLCFIHNYRKEREAAQTLVKFRKSVKTINAQLKRIVNSGESSHETLEERRSTEFEVIEDIGVLVRLRLKDKTPPLTIRFKKSKSNTTFKLFYSHDIKFPNEDNNHGYQYNVSRNFIS